MKEFRIIDTEAGWPIEDFDTLKEAEEALKEYEETDKRDGVYTPGFYAIKRGEN